MSDDSTKFPPSIDVPLDTVCLDASPQIEPSKIHDVEPIIPGGQVPSKPENDVKQATENNTKNGDARSDSEAETVVLSGKEETSNTVTRKSIRHEGNEKDDPVVRDQDHNTKENQTSLKRKTSSKDPTAAVVDISYSSNLSSTASSPAADARSSSRAGSETTQSRSKASYDSESRSKEGLSRKRKIRVDATDEKDQHKTKRRGTSSEVTIPASRHDDRKVTKTRSESPPTKSRLRAPSISTAPQVISKRRKPPPLLVDNRRKSSDYVEGDSDDSSSAHGHTHLSRLLSADSSAMSPAKAPHRKLKDRNGRTFLARACAADEIENVKTILDERLDDLDNADFAENTPLQIACLEGNVEVVKLLLDKGCKIDTENVDHDTPLIDAVENGHLEVINLLLAAGVDPRRSNGKGEEPLDLVNPKFDNVEAIKNALNQAKQRDKRRRSSDDLHGPAPTTGGDTQPAHSPRDSPALQSARSPPPTASGPRQRQARREATRNDILYINPTPENLRKHAGIGDIEVVNRLLQMRPMDDIEAVIAAARGGHEPCLQLLLAMGDPDHDPKPLDGHKPGTNTPMLAAIGRGKVGVIKLLLEQSGFNPTRRLYNNLTYFEISKERQGSGWQEEYDILKVAYDKYLAKNPNGSFPKKSHAVPSPRGHKKTKREPSSSSPRHSLRPHSPDPHTKDGPRRRRITDSKHRHGSRDEDDDGKPQSRVRKHLRVPSTHGSRDSSVVVSDRELSPFDIHKVKKARRSLSDGTASKEISKPRKRLISGKDLRNDRDEKRRVSLASANSSSSSQEPNHSQSAQPVLHPSVRREDSKEAAKIGNIESAKKRSRRSLTPSSFDSSNLRRASDIGKKVKRQRIDSNGKDMEKTSSSPAQSGPHKAVNMVPPSRPMGAPPPPAAGSAPVAFMGNSSESTTVKELTVAIRSEKKHPTVEIEKTKHHGDGKTNISKSVTRKVASPPTGMKEEIRSPVKVEPTETEVEVQAREQRARELVELQVQEKAARDEAERITREAERIRSAEQRRIQEAEEKARVEREAEEARAERQRKEEEALAEKKRKDEEQIQRLADRERMRKEEHERQERRRLELEERERLLRVRRLEEEERQKRESLPNSLKRAAEMSREEARSPNEIDYWLPLYTATGARINPDCDEQASGERWITNIQAAPILGITDLDLSQYTAWTKIPLNENHRMSLWRVLRLKLTRFKPPPQTKYTINADLEMDRQTRIKFFALEHIFWIKLSDLMDIAPRFPHLTGIALKCGSLALPPLASEQQDGQNSANGNGVHSLPSNGHHIPPSNGTLTNGFH